MAPDMQTEMTRVVNELRPMPTKVTQSTATLPGGDTVTRNRKRGNIKIIERLCDMVNGRVHAAELLGITESGLSTIIARSNPSLTLEIAARGIIKEIETRRRKDDEVRAQDHLLAIRVTPDKLDAIVAVCRAMGITVHDLNAALSQDTRL